MLLWIRVRDARPYNANGWALLAHSGGTRRRVPVEVETTTGVITARPVLPRPACSGDIASNATARLHLDDCSCVQDDIQTICECFTHSCIPHQSRRLAATLSISTDFVRSPASLSSIARRRGFHARTATPATSPSRSPVGRDHRSPRRRSARSTTAATDAAVGWASRRFGVSRIDQALAHNHAPIPDDASMHDVETHADNESPNHRRNRPMSRPSRSQPTANRG